jgi:predicted HicB family RNase H-like nuclease
MVVIRGAPRESLNLRVSPEIKRQVEACAEENGVSINAAACVLLTKALRAERKK